MSEPTRSETGEAREELRRDRRWEYLLIAQAVFAVVISMDVLTALLAITILKPMRRKHLELSAIDKSALGMNTA